MARGGVVDGGRGEKGRVGWRSEGQCKRGGREEEGEVTRRERVRKRE